MRPFRATPDDAAECAWLWGQIMPMTPTMERPDVTSNLHPHSHEASQLLIAPFSHLSTPSADQDPGQARGALLAQGAGQDGRQGGFKPWDQRDEVPGELP